MEIFKDILSRVEETSEVKRWTEDLIDDKIKEISDKVHLDNYNMQSKIDDIIEDHLKIP